MVEKDIPNAFVLPGEKESCTGNWPFVKIGAGFAAVIGHEIAHAVARHGGERLSQQLAIQGVSALGSELFKDKEGKLDNKTEAIIGTFGLGATVGVILPYSRTHELEAEGIGQLYMAKAGYDPQESIHLWEEWGKSIHPQYRCGCQPIPLTMSG